MSLKALNPGPFQMTISAGLYRAVTLQGFFPFSLCLGHLSIENANRHHHGLCRLATFPTADLGRGQYDRV